MTEPALITTNKLVTEGVALDASTKLTSPAPIFTINELVTEGLGGVTSGKPIIFPERRVRTRDNIWAIMPFTKKGHRVVIQTEALLLGSSSHVYRRGSYRYLLVLDLNSQSTACQELLQVLRNFESWLYKRDMWDSIKNMGLTQSLNIPLIQDYSNSFTIRFRIKCKADGTPLVSVTRYGLPIIIRTQKELSELFKTRSGMKLKFAIESIWFGACTNGIMIILDSIDICQAPMVTPKHELPHSPLVIEV